ncbi:MAG: GGDEF domain-containing protein, partial [Vibrio casei]
MLHFSKSLRLTVVVITLLTVFTISFFGSIYLQKRNETNIIHFYRSTSWYANRLPYQSERFLYNQKLYQLNAVSYDEFYEAYEVLWSRIDVFLTTSETKILRDNHPLVVEKVQELFSDIKSMDSDFQHPAQLHTAAFQKKINSALQHSKELRFKLSDVLNGKVTQAIHKANDYIELWQLIMFIICILLSANLLRFMQRFSALSKVDPLTQIGNRRGLFDYLKYRLNQNEFFAIVFMDLKRFKLINDEIGYEVGDQVLKMFANKIKKSQNCEVFRFGGDEFVLVADFKKNSPQKEDVITWMKALQQRLNFEYSSKEYTFPVMVRFGAACRQSNQEITTERLINNGIHALNEAKKAQDSDCVLYQDTIIQTQTNKHKKSLIQQWLSEGEVLPFNINL